MAIDFKVGDLVQQETFDGSVRVVRVELIEDDIKNGRPGFDGTLMVRKGAGYEPAPEEGDDLGNGVWGYSSQVLRVVR